MKSTNNKLFVTANVQKTLNKTSNNFSFGSTPFYVGEQRERVFLLRKKTFDPKKQKNEQRKKRSKRGKGSPKKRLHSSRRQVSDYQSSSNVSELLGQFDGTLNTEEQFS